MNILATTTGKFDGMTDAEKNAMFKSRILEPGVRAAGAAIHRRFASPAK
jgi:hypothetical protein